jgi:UbiD family decarboxylase
LTDYSKQRVRRVEKHVSLEDAPRRIIRPDKAIPLETTGTDYWVASNVITRENLCAIFDMEWKELQNRVAKALDNPIGPVLIDVQPFEKVNSDLRKLPVLKYYDSDPGPYIYFRCLRDRA